MMDDDDADHTLMGSSSSSKKQKYRPLHSGSQVVDSKLAAYLDRIQSDPAEIFSSGSVESSTQRRGMEGLCRKGKFLTGKVFFGTCTLRVILWDSKLWSSAEAHWLP